MISFYLSLWFLALPSFAAPHFSEVSGKDLRSGQKESWQSGGRKGLVVVFLSARCPCSHSHKGELASLAQTYHQDFVFLGLHSNADEGMEESKQYFSSYAFPVLQDEGLQWLDAFRAFKTPHAFVLSKEGRLVYKGGVSSSSRFAHSSTPFLREALENLRLGGEVRRAEGRTLGCVISRSRP